MAGSRPTARRHGPPIVRSIAMRMAGRAGAPPACSLPGAATTSFTLPRPRSRETSMSYMPRSILAAVPAGDRPAARSSTKYMETFQLVKPALGGTDIRTYPNADGNLDLYTIGTNDAIYRLRRGTDADAPYEDTNLNIKGRQLFMYTSGADSSNTPNIISLGENNQLKLAVYQSAVGSYVQAETKPANATEKIREFRGVRGITGNIYVNVMIEGPEPRTALLANNFFKPGTTTWAGAV